MKSGRRTLVLYGLVVGLFSLVLGWWLVFFARQGSVLVARLERADAQLSPRQAQLVREAAEASFRMFLFEGAFLLLLLVAGVLLVLRAMRREVRLYRQQREFFSAVTHELKSPLASARLHVESLLLGRVQDQRRELYLRRTHEDLDRLAAMVDRVLESARAAAGRTALVSERFDLAELARRTVERLRAGEAAHADVRLEADQEVVVHADPAALETILRNLLSNALKYGGAPPRVRVRVERRGARALLQVIDGGPGLRGSDPKRLFEPFVRGEGELEKSRPGVGLGLYLVAELTRALGGEVRARQPAEGGLSVEIALAAEPEPAPLPVGPEDSRERPPREAPGALR